MYGATEATARMAWLPPDLAEDHPDSIGVAIPGGHLRLDESVDDRPGVGELVYTGPNVMLGYAEEPADLALPPRDDRAAHRRPRPRARRPLRGGRDDATAGARSSACASTSTPSSSGLRADVDRHARVVATGRAVHAFVTSGRGSAAARALVADRCGVPPHAVRVTVVPQVPLTSSGKPDYAALGELATQVERERARRADGRADRHARTVRADVVRVLGRPDATDADSFVSLGGDSLSYVELATRLADHFPRRAARRVARARHRRARAPRGDRRRPAGRRRTTGTSRRRPPAAPHDVPRHDGRAAGARDPAHRRQPRRPRRPRGRRPPAPRARRLQLRALPALRARRRPHPAAARPRRPGPARRTGGAVGRRRRARARQLRPHHRPVRPRGGQRLGVGRPVAAVVPRVARVAHRRRAGRRPRCRRCTASSGVRRSASRSACWPWRPSPGSPRSACAPARPSATPRSWWRSSSPSAGRARGPRPPGSACVVTALAARCWSSASSARCTARSSSLGGFLLLLWRPHVPVTPLLARVAGVLATASLFIYLTHWQVYPALEDAGHQWLALVASLTVGIAYAHVVRPVHQAVGRAVLGSR